MSKKQISFDYPKDTTRYHYAYITLVTSSRGLTSRLLPGRNLYYQIIDEVNGGAFYTSEKFNYWVSQEGRQAYVDAENYMIQNGWERDGDAYSVMMQQALPRYRKRK